MPSDLDSAKSATNPTQPGQEDSAGSQPPGWLKMGVIAAASALAGGLAAAWFYKKTLTQLRQAANDEHNPEFTSSAQDIEEDH